VPTSGAVTTTTSTTVAPNWAFSWYVNWGDGGATQTATGTSSQSSPGISHNYAAPGQYQITIRPTGAAASGWMNAYGAFEQLAAWSTSTERILSFDTPLTNLMRISGAAFRFSRMFWHSPNLVGLPENLFWNISTAGVQNCSLMFQSSFNSSVQNSTTATIPDRLFDFSGLNTSGCTDVSQMFQNSFAWSFKDSVMATIPAGLFDRVSIQGASIAHGIFRGAFNNAMAASSVATIPSGLFDFLDTRQKTGLQYMFESAFNNFAKSSAAATIPANLFASINTSSATNTTDMYRGTFLNYGVRTATFVANGAVVDTQEFAAPYATKNTSR
jgi:hypothetical protein